MFKRKPEVIPDSIKSNNKQARKVVNKSQKTAQNQIRDVQRQAKATRRDWALRMNNFASDLRWEMEHLMDDEDKKRANRVAHDIEKIATNIEKRAQFQLKDASIAAKRNVWQTVLMTFFIGVVVGIIIKNMRD